MKSAKTSRSFLYLALAVACSLQMGCGSGTPGDSVVGSKQGTVNVEGLKVGVPETIIKDAVLTFVLDEQPAAKAGGRNQYLSRTKDSKGGQFSAQCKDGNCFRLEAIYETPITKEQALDTLSKMLPTSAGAPTPKTDDKNKQPGIEKYECGDNFVGQFTFSEKEPEKVRLVAAIDKSKQKKDGDDAKEGGEDKAESKDEAKEETKAEASDDAKTEETTTTTKTETETKTE